MTINGNPSPQPPSIANAFGRAVLGFVVAIIAFVFVWLVSVVGCLVGLNLACDNGLNAALVVAVVIFASMAFVALAPIITGARLEEHIAVNAINLGTALTTNDTELMRIERERIQGMNNAAIKREDAKTDLVLALGKAAAAGGFDPTTFIAIVNAANSDSAQFRVAAGVGFNVAALPQATFNPQDYGLYISGGLDSPIQPREMAGGYLTCTLKSLQAAASIALQGSQPTRGSFNVQGILAAEEVVACQRFLRERGLLTESDHSRWAERFHSGKFAKWVSQLAQWINAKGGEALFLRAAAMQTETVSPVVSFINP